MWPLRRFKEEDPKMFVLQRMASSHSLFAASAFVSGTLLNKPSLHSNLNRLTWPPRPKFELRALALYKTRNGFSTCSAAATETLVSGPDQTPTPEQNTGVASDKVVLLPTNDSSEKLLRIRHTVTQFFFLSFLS